MTAALPWVGEEAGDSAGGADEAAALGRRVQEALLHRGETVAVAESLTGGALGAALTALPGSSATFRGGVTAYASDLKAALLGVDVALLASVGAVDPLVATQMAAGVRERLQATYGLATTGVAGPDAQDGHPPGEVHLAVAGPSGGQVVSVTLSGGRAVVRAAAVRRALAMLVEHVGPQPPKALD